MTSLKSCVAEMGQEEAVVQLRAPRHRLALVGLFPELGDGGAQQELLREAHARVGRHFEAAQFEQAVAARGAVGIEELVDAEFGAVGVAGDVGEDVAEDAVDEPWRDVAAFGHLAEGEFQFVEDVVARLVDARHLAGRAEEHAGEKIRERRMVLPVADEAAQQVGTAQQRAVERRSRRRARCGCRRRCRHGVRRAGISPRVRSQWRASS